jgi:hypothetical protein
MLLIYQAICGALALLVGAVVLRPSSDAGAYAPAERGRRLGLQVTGALVLVPLLLRLLLVK